VSVSQHVECDEAFASRLAPTGGGCKYSPHKNLYTDYNLYNYLDLTLKRPLGSLLLTTLNP
jgi:hypothetical protein